MADTGATLNGKAVTVNGRLFAVKSDTISYREIVQKAADPHMIHTVIFDSDDMFSIRYLREDGSTGRLRAKASMTVREGDIFTVTPS